MALRNDIIDRLLAYQVETAAAGDRPAFALFGLVAAVSRSREPVGLRALARATGMSDQGALNVIKVGKAIGVLDEVMVGKWPKYQIPSLNSLERSSDNDAQVSRALDGDDPDTSGQSLYSVEHPAAPRESLNSVERSADRSAQLSRALPDPSLNSVEHSPGAALNSVERSTQLPNSVERSTAGTGDATRARGFGTQELNLKHGKNPPPLSPPAPERHRRFDRSSADPAYAAALAAFLESYPVGHPDRTTGNRGEAERAFWHLVEDGALSVADLAALPIALANYTERTSPEYYKAPQNFLRGGVWREWVRPKGATRARSATPARSEVVERETAKADRNLETIQRRIEEVRQREHGRNGATGTRVDGGGSGDLEGAGQDVPEFEAAR